MSETTKATQADKIRAFIAETAGLDIGLELTQQAVRLAERLGLLNDAPPVSSDPDEGDDFAEGIRQRMRVALEANKGAHPWHLADIATDVALGVARSLLDDLTQASEETAGLRQRCAELAKATPDPSVREVPASEARPLADNAEGQDGDLVTITGTLRTQGGAGIGILPLAGGYHDWSVNDWRLELSRPVTPLPDKPGAVGTATVRGVEDVRVALRQDTSGRLCWIVLDAYAIGLPPTVEAAGIAHYRAELPGAGVDEGGKP